MYKIINNHLSYINRKQKSTLDQNFALILMIKFLKSAFSPKTFGLVHNLKTEYITKNTFNLFILLHRTRQFYYCKSKWINNISQHSPLKLIRLIEKWNNELVERVTVIRKLNSRERRYLPEDEGSEEAGGRIAMKWKIWEERKSAFYMSVTVIVTVTER